MNELIADLRAAYGDKIDHAPWMDAPTRKEALTKLATFDPRIGHPGQIYRLFGNDGDQPHRPARQRDRRRTISTGSSSSRGSRKPVDRSLWDMNAAGR